jgi:hypothetical protein
MPPEQPVRSGLLPDSLVGRRYLPVGGHAGKTERQETRDEMSDDRYRKIFDDLTSDLFAVAKKHGKRALREAVRDAARGELLQEEEDDIPPEELDFPDEDVWTLPPAPEVDLTHVGGRSFTFEPTGTNHGKNTSTIPTEIQRSDRRTGSKWANAFGSGR